MDRKRVLRILNSAYPIFSYVIGDLWLETRRVVEKHNDSVYRVTLKRGSGRSFDLLFQVEEVTPENAVDRLEELMLQIDVATALFGWGS